MSDETERRRRGPMRRIGELIPAAASQLGLADELRRARAVATFDAIVAEQAPAAHGACRAIRVEGDAHRRVPDGAGRRTRVRVARHGTRPQPVSVGLTPTPHVR